jgi:hypothetical protein
MKVTYEVREDPHLAVQRMELVKTQEAEGSTILIVCKVGQIEYTREFDNLNDAKTFIHSTFMFWKNPKFRPLLS